MTAVGLARRIVRAGIPTRLSDLRMSAIDKLAQYCDPSEAVRAVGVSAARAAAWRDRHDGVTPEARARLARTRKRERRISRDAVVPRPGRAATADSS